MALRIAVVGVNNQGEEHVAAALRSDAVRLTALCDADPGLLDACSSHHGLQLVRRHATLAAAAADPEVDALVVALPHHLHGEAVDAAVRHGKHLLKEKPLARTLREAHTLARSMRAAGLVLHTGVQRRHHATYRALRQWLEGRRVVSADVRITLAVPGGGPPTWRDDVDKAGGGVLIDLGYHGIDLAHYLFGPLQLLSATLARAGAPCPVRGIESTASVWAVAGDAWVHLSFARADRKEERVVLELDDGSLAEADRERVTIRAHGREDVLLRTDRSWQDTLVEQLATFARAVEAGADATNDLAEQTPTLRFLERCYAQRAPEGIEPEVE